MIGMRISRRWGPARIGYRLGMQPSTVHKILRRYGCPPLVWTDPATGVRIKWARRTVHSYVHEAPGDLVHVDIKKLGRIPDGGGWRFLGRAEGKRRKSKPVGYWYIHNAADDCTRLAYSECSMTSARRPPPSSGSGPTPTSHQWASPFSGCSPTTAPATARPCLPRPWARRSPTSGPGPYRPQTNGKVERFNRTTLEEWAYAKPYDSEAERAALFSQWLHTYNHCGHTALGGKSPAVAR